MSKPVLKGIDFGSVDLGTYVPENPHNFCVWLTLSIGPEDAEGSQLFQVGICTPTWLAHQLSIKSAFVLKHLIIVEHFDFDLIRKTVQEVVMNAERLSWDQSIQILCRYFAWEFEDYQA